MACGVQRHILGRGHPIQAEGGSDLLRDHLTVLEGRMAGLEFGAEFAEQSRLDFETALVAQLAVLGERLTVARQSE